MTSSSNQVKNVQNPLTANPSAYHKTMPSYSGVNYVTLPSNQSQSILSSSSTGLQDGGDHYDDRDMSMFNIFRSPKPLTLPPQSVP